MNSGRIMAGRQINTNRERYDFYPTDPRWVRALLSRVSLDGQVCEPCAGNGAMVDEMRNWGFSVYGFDIEPRREDIDVLDTFSVCEYENVVTNAPFSRAFDMAQHWLNCTSGKVCLLTQYSFLETGKRGRWFNENPPIKVVVCCKRMDVMGKKSQFPHVWVVWDNQINNKHTELEWAVDF